MRQHFKLLYIGIVCAALLTSSIGILQAYGLIDLYEQTAAPAATYINRNFASHVVVLALPALIALSVSRCRTSWLKVFCSISGVVLPVYLIYTTSRNALLACLFTVVIATIALTLIILRNRDFVALRKLALLIGLIVVGLGIGGWTQVYTVEHTGSHLGSKIERATDYAREELLHGKA